MNDPYFFLILEKYICCNNLIFNLKSDIMIEWEKFMIIKENI